MNENNQEFVQDINNMFTFIAQNDLQSLLEVKSLLIPSCIPAVDS